MKAAELLKVLSEGIDPGSLKKDTNPQGILFKQAAEEWFDKKKRDGRATKTLKGIRLALDNDMLPALGDTPLRKISRQQCAELQKKIETRGAHNTSEKVRAWLKQIFGEAIGKGWCENNPASNLSDIAEVAPREKQYPHLLEPDLPDFLRALQNAPSKILARTAAWMVIRTASRPGMVRTAEWSEINLEKGLWEIPEEKMKMGRAHINPLPRQLIADLEVLHQITGRSKYLFPGEGSVNPTMSDGTINKLFESAGYKGRMTGHGSRHTCTTLLSEHNWPEKWSSAQLSHFKKGMAKVYDKAAFLKQRVDMMQWYSDYLDALQRGITEKDEISFAARVPFIKDE